MSIVLQGSTSGSITLQEPAVAGSNVINLPAATGTAALLQTPSFATTIGVGGATAASNGAGITFPATQSASSDANTLDDYEEGTFTPTIEYNASATGIAYTTQRGQYTKIGNIVSVQIYIYLSNKGTGGGAFTYISGLPFTTNSSATYSGGAVGYVATVNNGFNTAYIEPNSTKLILYNSIARSFIGISDLQNTSELTLQATYRVA